LLIGNEGALFQRSLAQAPARQLAPDGFFHRTLFGLTLFLILASAVGFSLSGGAVRPVPLFLRAVPPVLMLAGIVFYRWRKERRLQSLLTFVFWSLVFGLLYIPPMYLAARCPVPFQDDKLAAMDRALGLEVPVVLQWAAEWPRAKWFLDFCYDTLLFLVVTAILLPPVCGRTRRAKEYLIAGIASAFLSFPLFALMPAVGPWRYHGYPPTPDQQKVTEIITALKSQESFVLDYFDFEGIISFPSFHTVLALLAAFALWSVPYVRWPAALLAGLIVLSTVTTGWHYLVDVWAGVVIAGVSCILAKGFTGLETRITRPACSPELPGGVPS
jgi:hypothetical protein